ncbi:hypothetical protein DEJ48_10735 [Streptomyces venezuelae]|uniref:Uncharacterized protein n=1 Tax=Streptomyces venezuelae TaxID=54571 RepID=A0A5P2BVR1_STRVZ|nr:hypothetical protein [Streptomyces venezuelae]QES33798.1 hypothetical protein DEJ48_10735 [Streptomyces venezuelae]
MPEMPYLQQRILVRAAQRDDHAVTSKNADALMSLYAADLVDRGALTPSGLAVARGLLAGESVEAVSPLV